MSRVVVNDGNIRNLDNLQAQVWNGQIEITGNDGHKFDISCLSAFTSNPACPLIDLNDPTPVGDLCPIPGSSKRSLHDIESGETMINATIAARQASCPIQPGGPDPESPGGAETKTITWTR